MENASKEATVERLKEEYDDFRRTYKRYKDLTSKRKEVHGIRTLRVPEMREIESIGFLNFETWDEALDLLRTLDKCELSILSYSVKVLKESYAYNTMREIVIEAQYLVNNPHRCRTKRGIGIDPDSGIKCVAQKRPQYKTGEE